MITLNSSAEVHMHVNCVQWSCTLWLCSNSTLCSPTCDH